MKLDVDINFNPITGMRDYISRGYIYRVEEKSRGSGHGATVNISKHSRIFSEIHYVFIQNVAIAEAYRARAPIKKSSAGQYIHAVYFFPS